MNARKGTALLGCGILSLIVLASVEGMPSEETKDQLIQDALNEGAIIVQCASGVCRDTHTQEVVGRGNDGGPFLLYPDTPVGRAAQARMQARLQHMT